MAEEPAESKKQLEPSATLKVRRSFHRWLKLQAADSGENMYELVERLVADGLKDAEERPWRRAETT